MHFTELSDRLDSFAFLDSDHASAIKVHGKRLEDALASSDSGLALGSAKDLLETVCKVTCTRLEVAYGSGDGLPSLAKKCHERLDIHPSAFQDRQALKRITGSLTGIPVALAELRNAEGAGHGHPFVSNLFEESVLLAAGAAVLWAYWVLAALKMKLDAEAEFLGWVQDIESEIFRTGEFRAHLLDTIEIDLRDAADQRTCGVASARRSVSGTFMIALDVLNPMLEGTLSLPVAFKLGLIEGFLLNRQGFVRSTPVAAGTVIPLLQELWPSHADELRLILKEVLDAHVANTMDDEARIGVSKSLRSAAASVDDAEISSLVADVASAFDPGSALL